MGIGRATVVGLLAEGARVVVGDFSEIAGVLHDELSLGSDRLLFRHGDMADESFCKTLADQSLTTFGGIDCLVNSALSFIARGEDACTEDWMHSFVTGPLGFARMIQNVTPSMRTRGGGAIVNVGSISGVVAQRGRWTYNVSKGSVNQLTRCAALDLAVDNIRVNSVSPSWIWSQQVLAAASADGGGREKWDPI
jgi:NAD(P)-dependent dehydrogenase (short-subunit alcohol dehydrogenase family)